MTHGGNDFFHQVCSAQAQGGGVDAGVAAEEFALQHILVDEQLHPILPVVHQAQHAEAAGGDVQKLLDRKSVV